MEKMQIEKIYQKKSQLEHILLRPDTYIGSVEMLEQEMWIWDMENEKMIKKEIKFVPGLYKIFDEILVNAADNKQRDPNMSLIRINIDKENRSIRIYNNGRGIPVVEHKEEKVLVPTLIFGHLLTSSNYNDEEKKVTGGRNGYGAKLCNIFSKKFVLETSSKEFKKSFKQVWHNNMSKAEDPVVKEAKDEDFTCVTFVPDLAKFKMDRLDDDTIALMARRAYDIAASTPHIKVYLNDKRLPINKFEDYCKLYLSSELDEAGNPSKLMYEKVNDRWEVAVAVSDTGFQQVSFVNSIATTKGGRHVDYIADQLIKHLTELVNKKNKNGSQVKPFQIKNHMWLFVNCLIENPTFDSQTKENMTLQAKSFGSKCQLSEDFYKRVTKSGLLEKILTWLAFKEKTELEKAGSKSKMSKIKGIPKLDDANDAGTKDSMNCTLIVTEGDSAKTLAVAGLGVIGRDKYGVFPLRGKMLNVREATARQIIENSEVANLLKIIGLNFKEKYETRDSLKQLRYGKLMIMTDQDHDGSHIKGLIINFIHHQWPNLLKHGFVEEFITPIVKVSKGNQEKSFYSMPEFEEWQQNTDNWTAWKIKYYKGLGTSTSKEAKEYFSDMQRHRIKFEYASARDDLAIQLAFSKRFVDERKDWLTRFMEERKIRRENNSVDDYLYQKDTKGITYTDFINKELVLFSNLDNERSIPSLVDGFKPGQRKVLFSCFKRNLVKELKVAQLAGSVAELSAYHHGEASLMSTIINLAQNFVGSNNINLLQPIGQFGTRLHGGKDAASPRYIFTCMSPLTRLIFNPKDDPLFNYLNDDGTRVEPEWYCPILPTVLVNGAEGIGTGWSTKIPNFNPREIIANLHLMIDGQTPKPMLPFYKNFRGKIQQIDDIRVITNGEVAVIGENTIEITELPIGVWTQHYKETVLELYLHGQEKIQPCISDYKEYHTDTTVRFVVKMTPEQFRAADTAGLHKFFKLQKPLSLNSMVLFDKNGCLRRYDSVDEILREFFDLRSLLYKKRKEYMEGMLKAESLKLDNVARFILEKIEGKIKVENLKKTEIIRILKERGYDGDPVAKWKAKIAREQGLEDQQQDAQEPSDSQENEAQSNEKKEYDYLLGMPIWNLTMEKKEEILKQQKQKGDELQALRAKTHLRLWLDDLDEFSQELDKYETKEKEDDSAAQVKAFKAGMKQQSASLFKNKSASSKGGTRMEYQPAPDGERIEPKFDPSVLPKVNREPKTEATVKKELNIVDIITNSVVEARQMPESEIIKFASNVMKPAKAGAKEPKVKAEKKITKEPKESKEPKAVKSEKNSDEFDIVEMTDSNDANSDVAPVKKKPTAATKAPAASKKASAAKKDDGKIKSIKSYFSQKNSDDSEESFSPMQSGDDSISLDSAPPVERRVIARNRKEVNYQKLLGDDDDYSNDKDDKEDDYCIEDDEEASKESYEKPKAAKKKKLESDSDDDDKPQFKRTNSKKEIKEKDGDYEFMVDEEIKAISKKRDLKKETFESKKKEISVDSDLDDDFEMPPAASKAISKKPSQTKLVAGEKKKAAAPAAKDDEIISIDNDDDEDAENKFFSLKKTATTKTASKIDLKSTAATTTTKKVLGETNNKLELAKPKAAATKAPSTTKKSKYSDSDNEDDDDFVVDDDSDSDFDGGPSKKSSKAPAAKKNTRTLMPVADIFKKTKAAAAATTKKPAAKKVISDSDDDGAELIN